MAFDIVAGIVADIVAVQSVDFLELEVALRTSGSNSLRNALFLRNMGRILHHLSI